MTRRGTLKAQSSAVAEEEEEEEEDAFEAPAHEAKLVVSLSPASPTPPRKATSKRRPSETGDGGAAGRVFFGRSYSVGGGAAAAVAVGRGLLARQYCYPCTGFLTRQLSLIVS